MHHRTWFLTKPLQLLHRWWLAYVSFESRKNTESSMTSIVGVLNCNTYLLYKVMGSCGRTVKVTFAVWASGQATKTIIKIFWPQSQPWLRCLWEWPPLVQSCLSVGLDFHCTPYSVSVYLLSAAYQLNLQDLKNFKNVKRCRDGMPKSMQTR